MRYYIKLVIIALLFMAVPAVSFSALNGEKAHNLFIYPVVRVTLPNAAGSGTVIYSEQNNEPLYKADSKYSTYVLTNYHVIDSAIEIVTEWDSSLREEVKKEKRSIVHVEIFQYKDLSTPVGTLKVEAEIVIYNKDEDMALLKLALEGPAQYVAKLRSKEDADNYYVMDESIAVGCSLACPPLPTTGVITRKNFQIESYPFHMSSSQIIYGNSGGAMFHNETGDLIGIPSLVPVIGWGTPVTHMGLFIPLKRVYDWLEKEHYTFIFDKSKTETACLEERKKAIEAKKKAKNSTGE